MGERLVGSVVQAGGPGFADSLARGSPEPVLSVTPSGRVLVWTRRAELAYGYSRAEAIGRQLLTLVVPPEGVEELQAALATALATGSARCSTMRRRKDGTLLPPMETRLERRGEGLDASVVFLAGREASDATRLIVHAQPEAENGGGIIPALEAPTTGDALWRDAHDALSTSFSSSIMLQRLAALLVPRFADWVTADVLESGSLPRRVAVAHKDPTLLPILDAGAGRAEDVPAPLSSARVLRNAQAIVQATPAQIPDAPHALVRVGHGAHIMLPLLGRSRLLGAITMVRAGEAGFTEAEVTWARELARRASLEIENAVLADQVARLRETARHATERARQLHALSSALSEALTPAQVTQEAIRHARDALGACGGAIAMLSTDHSMFEITALVDEAEPLSNGTLRFPIHANFPLADAARSGDPVLLDQLISGAPRYPYLAHSKRTQRGLACVPLVVDGRHVGSLGLVFPERRAFSTEDVEFMRSLARHAADALERARLYGAERSARAQADAEARRSAFLADASRILSSSFDYRATMEATARLCVPVFADWCAVYLREPDGGVRPVAVVHHDPAKMPLARELLWRPAGEMSPDVGVAKVLRSGKPEVFESIPDAMLETLVREPETRGLIRQLGLRAQIIMPLVARDRTLGAIALCFSGHRRLGSAELQLIEELARRAAFAVDNARLYHEVEDAYRRKEESVAALRESEERYRLLVEGAPDYALFLLDPDGRIASWNAGAERLLGFKAEDVIGKTAHMFFTPEDVAARRPERDIEEALLNGRSEQEGWRMRKDGSRYWANVVVTILRDAKGEVRGYSKIHRDITDRKLAREELDRARQRVAQHEKLSTMGTLVSGVAHEIRTPLTAIANSLHLIRLLADRGSITSDALKRHSQLALEGVDRINALVQDLRRFKRVDQKGRTATSLDTVVAEALSLFRAAHRGRVEILADLQPTPVCDVDPAQLQQIVLNLLQNASEAMPHGGNIELRTGPAPDGGAMVRVRDEGSGMSAEVKARMFEEFFTTKADGTGLGLSIVRRIIELHNGRIECDSEPGKGTCFTLTLPAKA